MNNKNTLIGFILIAAILFGWMYFMSPSKEQLAEQQRIQDSIRRARIEQMAVDSLRQAEQQAEMQLAALTTDSTQLEGMDSLALAQQQQNALRDKYGMTFIIVTHDESLAALTDRTICLKDGRIVDNLHDEDAIPASITSETTTPKPQEP